MATLGVNIDHIATLRQARGGVEPEPVHGASVAEIAGCHGITAHLREDRRHMIDRDIYVLKEAITCPLNLEMALTEEMVSIACDVRPYMTTIVPEKREERTTEGGLIVQGREKEISPLIQKLQENNTIVSIFIDPDFQQIKAAKKTGATHIELHTGYYANAQGAAQKEELEKLSEASEYAHKLGFTVNAGHGLNYHNTAPIAQLPHMNELNIGHSIISRAVFVGLERAVQEMLRLINTGSLV
ncbi:pyridoxine 5'-phosphate synthase [Chitinivibrio alkaliphilus]|uniref:Pyridoxine 5'-phosphate synthase n=1 Tax=Chitinivibrio alkaliphilus ACht1 TaxID=1313304 RepID=U7D7A4_9BACT|nr:pyridoxine 5'-phosphate synthase [Chitinivibrio alkaliphilus]ERP38815.1 pyridoxine 5'-phosphate synthase [Chitinivibrio alkaliphilus ACht1]